MELLVRSHYRLSQIIGIGRENRDECAQCQIAKKQKADELKICSDEKVVFDFFYLMEKHNHLHYSLPKELQIKNILQVSKANLFAFFNIKYIKK